ncbi:DUF3422 family protein [Lutibaculum baratangense]|uniref:Membrane-anchored protein n=1 Tax=Lutibaculum baratangense AMV1 TaxID=631454 RepID=V4THP6_9HYPH|nr:DUF3422 domain-containing protein [Lutibaculum baratangense]ESR25553.1 hypothetical protein N177_1665 [Lutibaculum baratangense AMV1]
MTSADQGQAREPRAPFAPHADRETIISEVHTRPFRPLRTPRVLHHMAFLRDVHPDEDRDNIARFATAHGALPPAEGARHHVVVLGSADLAWEQHTEFTTLTLGVEPPPGYVFAAPKLSSLSAFLPKPSGPLLVAARLAIVELADHEFPDIDGFDPSSVCVSLVEDGGAVVVTDFRPDESGFTRILVGNRRLSPARAGALAQRLLEIETYRVLALLGLPEARRLGPLIDQIEIELAEVMRTMRRDVGLESSSSMLHRLVALAAEVESESAIGSYRFGATRAYDDIVTQRLRVIGETRVEGYSPIEEFLARRMRPAMATCRSVEHRMADLTSKLSRAADLLRTRVDIAVESQNRDLLASMNRRARMQLRLQQTVEGLSVAAVSYYVIGLIGYLVKGLAEEIPLPVEPGLIVAAAVPVVILLVWGLVRRIRRHHADPGADAEAEAPPRPGRAARDHGERREPAL